MDITTFFAAIWGPVLLAVGLGMFISPRFYTRVYRELEDNAFTVLVFGLFATTLGIMHVMAHTAWGSVPQSIVTILGWGMLAKGALFLIAPHMADTAAKRWAQLNILPIAGAGMLVLGLYLSWLGYLA